MPLELPHTAGCLVCGPGNRYGLHLHLFVEPATGIIRTRFTPEPQHIGFEGVAHGGIIATVMDEVMVWAASWAGKRFCLCGEMSVRFRNRADVGQIMLFTAQVETVRSKLISTTAQAADESGKVFATATGKYVPLPDDANQNFIRSFVENPATSETAELMRRGS
jgi:acyl-coenzyme A thioesterase PaaI-like protein